MSESERESFLTTFMQEPDMQDDIQPVDVLTLRKRSESMSTAVSATSETVEIQ